MTPRPLCAVPLLCAVLASACGGGQGDESAAAASTGPTTSASTTPSLTTTTTPPTTTTAPSKAASATTPATRHTTAAPKPKVATSLAVVPRAGAEPTVRFPKNEAAAGSGANASIASVPNAVWNRMVGYSWTQGCPVGRSQLRYVRVNFWGFDGKRSRGSIVVNASIADETAAAFTRLYALQFRIRQMKPMDSSWGKNPKGPGANDYAAMEADNTSAFNCRYVGGEEASKVYSKHAYGTAIDVNDFENPYVAGNGTVYPDRYWLSRRGSAPGVFSSSGSSAVRAFTSQGLRWGGLWANPDYQHFDR
jgi:hypothetical protein